MRKHREARQGPWHPSQSRDAEKLREWLERAKPEDVTAFANIPLQAYVTLQTQRDRQAYEAAWEAKKRAEAEARAKLNARAEAWEKTERADNDLGFVYIWNHRDKSFAAKKATRRSRAKFFFEREHQLKEGRTVESWVLREDLERYGCAADKNGYSPFDLRDDCLNLFRERCVFAHPQETRADFVGYVRKLRRLESRGRKPSAAEMASFDALDLPITATREQVEKAFRAKAKAAHPDTGGAIEAFQRLNKAKESALRFVG